MPTPYEVGLFLVRLFAAINLVAGICAVVASFVSIVFIVVTQAHMFDGLPFTLFTYGVSYLSLAVGMLLFSKSIARFAASAFVDATNSPKLRGSDKKIPEE